MHVKLSRQTGIEGGGKNSAKEEGKQEIKKSTDRIRKKGEKRRRNADGESLQTLS